ncbi:MAG TPA: hypothetical protein VFY37_03525 [Solirubrobacterales bacterium]|nr:hypothetical protein [Solirubrobacterales bacterium]
MLRRFPDSRVVFGKMRTGALIAGVVAMLALAGCGGEDESPADPGDPGGAPLTGPLTYSRGGGIAGRMDKLVLQPDGGGTVTTKTGERTFKLEGAELQKLADDLQSADLPGLPEDSTADRTQPDAMGYRVVYDGATVSTESGHIPDRMGPLVATLDDMVDRYGAK